MERLEAYAVRANTALLARPHQRSALLASMRHDKAPMSARTALRATIAQERAHSNPSNVSTDTALSSRKNHRSALLVASVTRR